MKKKLLFILLAIMLLIPNASLADTQDVKLWINGSYVESDVDPFIQDSRTLVPIRVISETLGYDVEWDDVNWIVTVKGNNKVISMKIDSPNVTVNGMQVGIDVPPTLKNSRTFVPIRFISENFGLNVDWDLENWTAIVGDGYIAPKSSKIPSNTLRTRVNRVVDGDTIKIIYNGKEESLRLIGVDTPESVHSNSSLNVVEGKTASEFTKTYLENKEIFVEFDVQQRDYYGRLLGYVWLADGTLFNNLLLQKGMAKVATFPPNVKYVDTFTATQTVARNNRTGFWNSLFIEPVTPVQPTPSPTPTRPTSYDGLTVSPYTDRLIKGNISSSGEKIFHAPGQRDYNKTVIDESKGERWFATERDAINAGWRKAKR